MDKFTCELVKPTHYHLGRTLAVIRMGHHDPSLTIGQSGAQLCFATPEGPVSLDVESCPESLRVRGFGPGSSWIEPHVPAVLGLEDNPASFQPQDKMKRLLQQLHGLHLPRLPVVYHRLVQIILLQLVSWNDAFRAWRMITKRLGAKAPGPCELWLAPSAEQFMRLAYYDLVACGVMPKQARLILKLATSANRIEVLAADSPQSLAQYLYRVPGLGDWTVQHLLGSALGQADALLTGDYNMPHTVAWYLAGEERGSDERMLELLEPYRGHRFRVVSLLWQSGITAPRRGPRMASNRWRFSSRR